MKTPPPIPQRAAPIWKVSHQSYTAVGWVWVVATVLLTAGFAVFQLLIMVPFVVGLLGHKIPGLAVGAVIVLFGISLFVVGDWIFAKLGVRLTKEGDAPDKNDRAA